ncbi:hypothetical protein G7Y89_g6351 [Cudoniella acicularis]|uniref:Uncharacterized protein n=1 Tax=Cudoniella acicularis TaxID=354080 RepID=A0A8H4RLG8_9HELO|nr:hypothetical protein G7Y89_g6351 [Cudoniella acicularis]
MSEPSWTQHCFDLPDQPRIFGVSPRPLPQPLYSDEHRHWRPSISSGSRTPSIATSVSSASTNCRRGRRQSSGSSVSSLTSRPPWAPLPANINLPLAMLPITPLDHGYDLACEFGCVGCHIRFHPEYFESWIEHSLSHFGNNPPPSKAICTFCDREFDCALNPDDDDPFSNWRDRMMHIGGHFYNRRQLGADHPRPDYFLLDHMRNIGILSVKDYEDLVQYTERPYCDNLYPLGFVPPETKERKDREIRESRQIHDLGKERRQMKRERSKGRETHRPR